MAEPVLMNKSIVVRGTVVGWRGRPGDRMLQLVLYGSDSEFVWVEEDSVHAVTV